MLTLAPNPSFSAITESDINGNVISNGASWSPKKQILMQQDILKNTQKTVQNINKSIGDAMGNMRNSIMNVFSSIFRRWVIV